jgi:arylsulfatase A-like enzyme
VVTVEGSDGRHDRKSVWQRHVGGVVRLREGRSRPEWRPRTTANRNRPVPVSVRAEPALSEDRIMTEQGRGQGCDGRSRDGTADRTAFRRDVLKHATGVGLLGALIRPGVATSGPTLELTGDEALADAADEFDQQPNVVQILVDDLGWSDLGCYGSDFHETPNIDDLAADGTRFTDAYAASPICSPTRASLMTGQTPPRHGITDWIGAGVTEGAKSSPAPGESLPTDAPTTASLLSEAGYHTVHLGKWHLTNQSQGVGPTDVGFDQNVGGSHHGAPPNGYFCPFGSGVPNLSCSDDDYLPDRLTDEAVDILNNTSGPVFMNMAFYSVHIPLQARNEDIQYFQNKADQMNLPNTVESGDNFALTKKQNGTLSRRTIQSDATYAAMVYRMDYNVGRLLDAIEASDRPTVVLFHSDNGGLATAEGSPTYSDPLAEGKGWGYGGGIRVPTIVRWPGVTDGSVSDALVTTEDLYVTALRAAGVSVPADHTVDGRSLYPVLTGTADDREELYWHYPHYSNQGGTPVGAIRYGDYKLLEFYEDEHVELYDLANDVGERIDLSAALPGFAGQLRARLNQWQFETGAEMPGPNTDFNPWPNRKEPGGSYEWQPDGVPRYTPDASGEDNTGTVVGDGTQTTGRDGSDGFLFDGSTSVDLPSSDSLEVINAPLTVECWVKPGDPASGGQGFEPYVTQGESIMLHRTAQDAPAAGGVGVVLQTADGTYHAPHVPVPSDWQDTWHHLALVWDGSELEFYLDGDPAAADSCSGPLLPEMDHFAVGANLDREETGDRFVSDGTVVDSVRIYRRALSATELGANAASTGPLDSSTVLWLDFEEITAGGTPPEVSPYSTYASTDATFGVGDDAFTIEANGADTWQTADEYGAIYLPDAAGSDAAVTTTVTAQENTHEAAKAGIMIRNDITAAGSSAGYASLFVTPEKGFRLNADTDGDGYVETAVTESPGTTQYPVRLRLEKSGTTFTAATSTDGSTWTDRGSVDLGSADQVQDVGLFVTSHTEDSPSRVDFDGFTVVSGEPTDPDGDGDYEDLDGDGELTDADLEVYAQRIDDPELQSRVEDFDFNDNGRLDHDDLVELSKELAGSSN